MYRSMLVEQPMKKEGTDSGGDAPDARPLKLVKKMHEIVIFHNFTS